MRADQVRGDRNGAKQEAKLLKEQQNLQDENLASFWSSKIRTASSI